MLFLAWETIHPFFGFFRGRTKERGRHLLRNLGLAAGNSAMVALVFVLLWALVAEWAYRAGFGLLNWVSAEGPMRMALAVLLLDAFGYVWHRLNHGVALLWRFHRVHHSDTRMDVTTSGRYHVGEVMIGSLLRLPIIAVFGVSLGEILLFETLTFAVVQFHHANIALPAALDRLLRLAIVTPAMHKVHHSVLAHEMNANFCSLLTVWDRIGRTYRSPERPEVITFGLGGAQSADDSIGRLLVMPFDPVHGSSPYPDPRDEREDTHG